MSQVVAEGLLLVLVAIVERMSGLLRRIKATKEMQLNAYIFFLFFVNDGWKWLLYVRRPQDSSPHRYSLLTMYVTSK